MGKPPALRRPSDFDRVFRDGRRFRASALLVIRVRRDDGPLRVGFLTAKGLGNAVRRNRARRRLKEAFRALQPQVADQAADLVLMALPPLERTAYPVLRQELAALLAKAGLLPATDGA